MVCHSLLQWTAFCQTSPPWLVCLRWPHMAWLSFIELDKAVVHVIRLASCLWLWFQCVCPLMPSLSAYHLTWVSLTLDVGYLFTAAPAKHSHCSVPWTLGYLLSDAHHSCPTQLPLAACLRHTKKFFLLIWDSYLTGHEIPRTEEPGGLQSMGLQKSQTPLSD